MEFRVALSGALPNLAAINRVLRVADPSAQVDVDGAGHSLRVATSVSATELAALLAQADYPVDAAQVTQQPSVCCGGCSG